MSWADSSMRTLVAEECHCRRLGISKTRHDLDMKAAGKEFVNWTEVQDMLWIDVRHRSVIHSMTLHVLQWDHSVSHPSSEQQREVELGSWMVPCC